MPTKTIWVFISFLLLGIAISAFLIGVWLLQITHNTLEYSESLKGRVDTTIQNVVEREVEVEVNRHDRGTTTEDS